MLLAQDLSLDFGRVCGFAVDIFVIKINAGTLGHIKLSRQYTSQVAAKAAFAVAELHCCRVLRCTEESRKERRVDEAERAVMELHKVL